MAAVSIRRTVTSAEDGYAPPDLPRVQRLKLPALSLPSHATRDLYKWAHKLVPAVPSDLVMDCFELAREIRELDMRAAPYDLRELGYEPVLIETPEGKARYAAEQRSFAARGQALREQLVAACDRVLRPL